MGRYRTVRLGRDKEIVQCYSCSGKGCSSCNNCGHFEVIEDLLRDEYIDDSGRRDYSNDIDYEREVSRKPIKKGGGGCFITTATCEFFGKKDDCEELTVFRNFRDTWLKETNPEIIEEYYQIAPGIVKEINTDNDAEEIYKSIWFSYLQPTYKLILAGDNEGAMNLYSDMVNSLKSNYLNLDKSKSQQMIDLRMSFQNGKMNSSVRQKLRKLTGKSDIQISGDFSAFNDKWYKYIDIGD